MVATNIALKPSWGEAFQGEILTQGFVDFYTYSEPGDNSNPLYPGYLWAADTQVSRSVAYHRVAVGLPRL